MCKPKQKKLVICMETVRVLPREALAKIDSGLGPTAFCPMRNPRLQGG